MLFSPSRFPTLRFCLGRSVFLETETLLSVPSLQFQPPAYTVSFIFICNTLCKTYNPGCFSGFSRVLPLITCQPLVLSSQDWVSQTSGPQSGPEANHTPIPRPCFRDALLTSSLAHPLKVPEQQNRHPDCTQVVTNRATQA